MKKLRSLMIAVCLLMILASSQNLVSDLSQLSQAGEDRKSYLLGHAISGAVIGILAVLAINYLARRNKAGDSETPRTADLSDAPPLPAGEFSRGSNTWFHRAASYAIAAPLLAIVINVTVASVADLSKSVKNIAALLCGIVLLSALPAGIVALVGIRWHGRSRLLWKGLVGIGVTLLFLGAAVPAFLRAVQTGGPQAIATRLVKQLNSKAPGMIDSETRLDSAVLNPPDTVIINGTILSFEATPMNRSAWKVRIRPVFRAKMEKSELINAVRQGVMIIYHYSDKNGLYVDDLVFSPEEYPASGAKPAGSGR